MKDSIRFFDIVLSVTGLIILSPLFLLIAVFIKISSAGPVIYTQKRVGQNGREFSIFKFRTMRMQRQGDSLLTIGNRDKRITAVGYWLRRYKLDELPQLGNVLAGDMSMVGPRPEVKRYTDLYTAEQRRILSVKPGITDMASIEYRNENELLAAAANPEEFYIKEIMPHKIMLNMQYINSRTIKNYFKVIFYTLFKKSKKG